MIPLMKYGADFTIYFIIAISFLIRKIWYVLIDVSAINVATIAPKAPPLGMSNMLNTAFTIIPATKVLEYSSRLLGNKYWLLITSPTAHIGILMDNPIIRLEHFSNPSPQNTGANSFAIAHIPNINAYDITNETINVL